MTSAVEEAESECARLAAVYESRLTGWSWSVSSTGSTAIISWSHPLSAGFIQEHSSDQELGTLRDNLRRHFVESREVDALASLLTDSVANPAFLTRVRQLSLALKWPQVHVRALADLLLEFDVIDDVSHAWLIRYGVV